MVKRLRHHPFTVVSRVRIPVGSPDKPLRLTEEARPVTAEVTGSSPVWVVYGILAQLGEHLPYKQGVTGSSPVTSTKFQYYAP